MDNYPAGAANDPSASWNLKDPEMIECDECDGSGEVDIEDYEGDWEVRKCSKCDGFGEIEVDDYHP